MDTVYVKDAIRSGLSTHPNTVLDMCDEIDRLRAENALYQTELANYSDLVVQRDQEISRLRAELLSAERKGMINAKEIMLAEAKSFTVMIDSRKTALKIEEAANKLGGPDEG